MGNSVTYLSQLRLGSRHLARVNVQSTPHPAPFRTHSTPLLFIARQHRKTTILASLCLIVLFTGALRYQSNLPGDDENYLRFYNDQETVQIEGVVDSDPEVGDKTTHLRLSTTRIKVAQEWREISGTVLLFVPRYPTYDYGDELSVTGNLQTPPHLDDFDYPAYLARQGVYSTMLYPEIEIVGKGAGSKPLQWLYSLRNDLSRTLTRTLPEPQASLAQAILLGKRDNLPPQLGTDFSETGTSHLLAISGLHLSIVTGILLIIGIWLFGRRRNIYVWLALGAIWLYALLVGMNPPILRAAIMASLFLTATLLGRQRSAFTSLAFAAAIMIGINPQILWTASFQMSFAAMTGLIFIFPPLQSMGRKAVNVTLGDDGIAVSIVSIVTDSFSVTLGAIIAVWPVIAYHFGIISLDTLPATFFALPALPIIIVTTVLTAGVGLVALPIAQGIGWLAWFFLSYMLWVVKCFAILPPSPIEVDSVSPILIWTYYLILVAAIWLINNPRKLASFVPGATSKLISGISKSSGLATRLPGKWIIPPLLVTAIVVSLTTTLTPDDNLHVSFLDVGQGDAILIRKGNQDVLVDGGPDPRAISLELGKKLPFWDRTIELVILTHPSADHVTGLVEVLHRYNVGQVLYPGLEFQSGIYDEWLDLLNEKNVECTFAQAGQQIMLTDEVTIEVLNPQTPPLTDTQSDIDNNCVILRISIGEVSFLLTADAMWEAELELITSRANVTSTVLKVAHHGSKTSTSPEFLAVVSPQVAVISVGEDNPYGHPTDEVRDRLIEQLGPANIYRTDLHGTIEFITDGERLWVKIDTLNYTGIDKPPVED